MKILHPYTGLRPDDEKETWEFLGELLTMLREKADYEIVNRKMGVENGHPRTAYVDFIRDYWDGTDDLIILEDDKVPTLKDFVDLMHCPEKFCCFPYPMLSLVVCDMDYWRDIRPFTLGFVKFSKEVQQALPAEQWLPDIPDKPSLYPFAPVDMMIEKPLTAKLGDYHLHETPIKHNHPVRREK